MKRFSVLLLSICGLLAFSSPPVNAKAQEYSQNFSLRDAVKENLFAAHPDPSVSQEAVNRAGDLQRVTLRTGEKSVKIRVTTRSEVPINSRLTVFVGVERAGGRDVFYSGFRVFRDERGDVLMKILPGYCRPFGLSLNEDPKGRATYSGLVSRRCLEPVGKTTKFNLVAVTSIDGRTSRGAYESLGEDSLFARIS